MDDASSPRSSFLVATSYVPSTCDSAAPAWLAHAEVQVDPIVLLLPAAWTLVQSSGLWIGLGLAVVALAGVVAALLSPSPDLPDGVA